MKEYTVNFLYTKDGKIELGQEKLMTTMEVENPKCVKCIEKFISNNNGYFGVGITKIEEVK